MILQHHRLKILNPSSTALHASVIHYTRTTSPKKNNHNKELLQLKDTTIDYSHNYVRLIIIKVYFHVVRKRFNELVMWLENITETLHDTISLNVADAPTYWRDSSLLHQFKNLNNDVFYLHKASYPNSPRQLLKKILKFINLHTTKMTNKYSSFASLHRNIITIRTYITDQLVT